MQTSEKHGSGGTGAKDITPILGPTAKAAMRIDVGGTKRRKVLVLIAAYIDAGQHQPSVRELSARTGFRIAAIDGILNRLEADGHLTIERGNQQRFERNRYELPSLAPTRV